MQERYLRVIGFWCILIFILACEKPDNPILSACKDASTNWTIEISEHPNYFKQNDLFFPTLLTGYSVGHGGSVQKTSDGGKRWEVIHDLNMQNSVTELILNEVFFLDEQTGFIGGERMDFGFGEELLKGALLLSTLDGGATWTKKYFPEIKRFDDLLFFNHIHGISLAIFETDSTDLTHKLVRTSDAGLTWQELHISSMTIKSIEFESSGSFLFLLVESDSNEEFIAISSDNGLSWITRPAPEEDCNRIIFVNDNLGYLTCGLFFNPERLYKTEDQGLSWSLVENSPIHTSSITHFVSKNEALVINSIYKFIQTGGENMEVLTHFEFSETRNAGVSWDVNQVDNSCYFEGLTFGLDSTNFYIMGREFYAFHLK